MTVLHFCGKHWKLAEANKLFIDVFDDMLCALYALYALYATPSGV